MYMCTCTYPACAYVYMYVHVHVYTHTTKEWIKLRVYFVAQCIAELFYIPRHLSCRWQQSRVVYDRTKEIVAPLYTLHLIHPSWSDKENLHVICVQVCITNILLCGCVGRSMHGCVCCPVLVDWIPITVVYTFEHKHRSPCMNVYMLLCCGLICTCMSDLNSASWAALVASSPGSPSYTCNYCEWWPLNPLVLWGSKVVTRKNCTHTEGSLGTRLLPQ